MLHPRTIEFRHWPRVFTLSTAALWSQSPLPGLVARVDRALITPRIIHAVGPLVWGLVFLLGLSAQAILHRSLPGLFCEHPIVANCTHRATTPAM